MDSDAAFIIYLICYSPASRRISYDLGFSLQVLEHAIFFNTGLATWILLHWPIFLLQVTNQIV